MIGSVVSLLQIVPPMSQLLLKVMILGTQLSLDSGVFADWGKWSQIKCLLRLAKIESFLTRTINFNL